MNTSFLYVELKSTGWGFLQHEKNVFSYSVDYVLADKIKQVSCIFRISV